MYLYTGICHVVRNIKHATIYAASISLEYLAHPLHVLRWSLLYCTYLCIIYIDMEVVSLQVLVHIQYVDLVSPCTL